MSEEVTPEYPPAVAEIVEEVSKKPRNFFDYCVKKSGQRACDVYHKAGWSRQRFNSYMAKDRASSPKLFRTFRQALGWDKGRFYTELIDWYDFEPDSTWEVKVIKRRKLKKLEPQ